VYIAGGPIEQDCDFYGREDLLDALLQGVAPRVFLVGLRRTGKTSVLKAVQRRAIGQGASPLFLQLQGLGRGNLRDVVADAVDALSVALGGEGLNDHDFDQASLRALLRRTEQLARDNKMPLLVLIDEVEVLVRVARSNADDVRRLRSWLLGPGVSRVVLSGGRHAIRLAESGLLGDGEPFLAGFHRRLLPPVLAPQAALALSRLIQRNSLGAVNLSPADRQDLLRRTGGHAFVLQSACLALGRHGGSHAVAMQSVLDSHAAEWAYLEDLQRTSPSERLVLDAVVAGQPFPTALRPYARSLVEAGLLGPDQHLEMPMMAEFLIRRGWSSMPSTLTDAQAVPGIAKPSSTFAGSDARYRLDRFLGGGTFGVVYLARMFGEAGFERRVAIKVLREDWSEKSGIVARMRDEARILGLLRHPAIVRVEHLMAIEGRVALVMEYVDGVDLSDLIRFADEIGPVPVDVVAGIAGQAADALSVAWNGSPGDGRPPLKVLHRDIKPANLRLTPHGELKILDFGIATWDFEGREARTLAGSPGTPRYLAPERKAGQHDLQASDVYALGLVMAELANGRLAGALPTERSAHQNRVAELTAGLGDLSGLVRQALCFDPPDRPTMAALARDCWPLAGGALRTWARVVLAPLMPKEPGTPIPSSGPTVLPVGHTLLAPSEDSDWDR
jgi:serine/threonine-protein kinase